MELATETISETKFTLSFTDRFRILFSGYIKIKVKTIQSGETCVVGIGTTLKIQNDNESYYSFNTAQKKRF